MIIVGNALVSEDILEKKFECQISLCKGACCVHGDAGAAEVAPAAAAFGLGVPTGGDHAP